MSATIIAFPSSARRPQAIGAFEAVGPISATLADLTPTISATGLARKFEDHFLPVVWASIDLLEADEQDFEARCRGMLDAEGTVMIDELCAELQTVGQQMQILVDGLELTRARLRTAMARLAPPTTSYPYLQCPDA